MKMSVKNRLKLLCLFSFVLLRIELIRTEEFGDDLEGDECEYIEGSKGHLPETELECNVHGSGFSDYRGERKKRFLVFPRSTFLFIEQYLNIRINLKFKIPRLRMGVNHLVPLPSNTSVGALIMGRKLDEDRKSMYEHIAATLDGFRVDGKTCVLRAICEIHQFPFINMGIYAEALHLILRASGGLPGYDRTVEAFQDLENQRSQVVDPSYIPYLDAEYDGKIRADCSKYTEKCSLSIFNMTGLLQ